MNMELPAATYRIIPGQISSERLGLISKPDPDNRAQGFGDNPPNSAPPLRDTVVISGGGDKDSYTGYGRNGKAEFERASVSDGEITPSTVDSSTTLQTDSTEELAIQQEVARLKAVEDKVKAHEAAHKSAGSGITGAISYTYTRGPDGRNYITGGEVPISVSSGRTPQETASRMQQVIQTALAPVDPSQQDRAVAAQASVMLREAQQSLSEEAPLQTETAPPPLGISSSPSSDPKGRTSATTAASGIYQANFHPDPSTRAVSIYA